MNKTINVMIAGVGGQGVIKASDVLSRAAFRSGYDVKKSELHGMSQRGGSVCSDVRFGPRVWSPMVPPGEADFLLALEPDELLINRGRLRQEGVVVSPELVETARLSNRKSLNLALLGILSVHLDIPAACWLEAIHASFAEKLHAANEQAFAEGRRAAEAHRQGRSPA